MQFKYSYPNLERVEENDMRFYKDSNNDLVPSVTTVLDALRAAYRIPFPEYIQVMLPGLLSFS